MAKASDIALIAGIAAVGLILWKGASQFADWLSNIKIPGLPDIDANIPELITTPGAVLITDAATNAGNATVDWMKTDLRCWRAGVQNSLGLPVDSWDLNCLTQAERDAYIARLGEGWVADTDNPNYNVQSSCALNPATGGFICPDVAVPTEVPQEAINAALDYTHELAAQMRADMGITLNPEQSIMAGIPGCFGGRRQATQAEMDKLMVGPLVGCGRAVNPLTGEGYFYCDC